MKLEVITSRLSTNIDNLNKNKKYTFIPQDVMDEFVDILIDLREIDKKPTSTQRELAKKLNFSLGKLNYCLKALKKK